MKQQFANSVDIFLKVTLVYNRITVLNAGYRPVYSSPALTYGSAKTAHVGCFDTLGSNCNRASQFPLCLSRSLRSIACSSNSVGALLPSSVADSERLRHGGVLYASNI